MVLRSVSFETDQTEPRNYIFKAKNEFSILTFILLRLEIKKVSTLKKVLNMWPVVCFLDLDFVALLFWGMVSV